MCDHMLACTCICGYGKPHVLSYASVASTCHPSPPHESEFLDAVYIVFVRDTYAMQAE